MNSGYISGLWDAETDQQVLRESYDRYSLRTEEKEWEVDEKDDKVPACWPRD